VLWLRAEGLAVLLLSLVLYAEHGRGWLLLFGLLLAPDLSMIGYLGGPRPGALVYNLFHTYTAPLLLATAALPLQQPLLISLSLIWSAHIGMDRCLGYGLKLPGGFRDTHLGRIGKPPATAPPERSAPPLA
jgi:hypothetical protein